MRTARMIQGQTLAAARPRALAMVLAAAAGMPGCAVGPDHAAPAVETPGAWASPLEAGAVSAPGDLSRWWTVLGDPVLDALVVRALAGNHDLREAVARLAEARAQRGVVASQGGPQVDATGTYQRNRASESTGTTGQSFNAPGAERDLYQVGFDATWEIDVFGRVRRGVEAADADIAAAAENVRGVRVSLLAEVGRNYVELRAFQRRVEIARGNVAVQADTLKLVRARRDAGLSNDLDAARAEANLETTRAAIPTLEAGVRSAAYRLSVLLGREPGVVLAELTGAAPIPAVAPEVPLGLPSELLQRRPDVRGAEREVAAASARIGEATADLYPRFSLTGDFGFSSREIGNLTDSENRFWSFGPAVRWPILEWGRIRQNIKVQDARHEQSLIRFERAVLTAFEEVENALTNYARERDRRASLAAAVAADQRAVDLSTDLYTKGLTDFLTVLDSQRELFQLQDQLVQSERSVAANLIALYKALGGGWEEGEGREGDEPPQAASRAVPGVAPSPKG